jgi:aconitate hydratase
MLNLHEGGVYLVDKTPHTDLDKLKAARPSLPAPEQARKGTMAYAVLSAHDAVSGSEALNITFDALASHDITYVNAIQTAKASGLKQFNVPYVLTNCHNSLLRPSAARSRRRPPFRPFGGREIRRHLCARA